MAGTTKDTQKAEQKRIQGILDTINQDNYTDYVNEPMFAYDAVKPKGLTRNQEKNWNAFHYQINKDYDDAQKAEESKNMEQPKVNGTGTRQNDPATLDALEASVPNVNRKPAIEVAQENADKMSQVVNDRNEQLGSKKGFDTKTGKLTEGYLDFDSLKRDVQYAEDDYNDAMAANTDVQSNQNRIDEINTAKKANVPAKLLRNVLPHQAGKRLENDISDNEAKLEELKKTNDELQTSSGLSEEEIEMRRAEINEQLFDIDVKNQSLQKSLEAIKGLKSLDVVEELSKNAQVKAELEAEAANLQNDLGIILQKENNQEEIDNVSQRIEKLQNDKLRLLNADFNTWANYIDTDGTDLEKKELGEYNKLLEKINKVDEDGDITFEEAKALKREVEQCERNIRDAKRADSNIMDKERKLDNAKAKYSYYLWDEIKSWIVFAMGIGMGNPQMVYSALSNFNKKLSEGEAKYQTDKMDAFGKVQTNEITGKSDAAYSMEQVIPELEKYDAFKQIDAKDKARAVESLYDAYQKYKDYDDDQFKAYYTAELAKEGSNGWAGVITSMLRAGTLNLDTLQKLFGGEPAPDTKGNGVSYNLNKPSIFGNASNNVMDRLTAPQDSAVAQLQADVVRDKQGTVNSVLSSRMGGQGAAPQGGGTAQPVNSSWGQA